MAIFNYYFDIAAIFVFIVIYFLYIQQNLVHNQTRNIFLMLIGVCLISSIADILSAVSINQSWEVMFQASNTIYYLGQQWAAFFFLLFTLSPLLRRNWIPLFKRQLFAFPILGISIVIIVNIFTGCLYSYDFATGVYTYGFLQYTCYIPSLLYYGTAIYYVITRRDVYNRSGRYAIVNTLSVIVICIVLQALFPKYLLHNFAFSLACLQMLIVGTTQGITFDPRTGLLSKNAFYDRVNVLTYNKKPFNVVTLRMADYEVLLSTYGLSCLLELEGAVCASVKDLIPKNSGYKLSEDTWTVIFEGSDHDEIDKKVKELDRILAEKWTIKGVDISFSYFIVNFKYPDHFKVIPELRSLIVYLQKTKRMRYGIMPIEEFALRDFQREADVEKAITEALNTHGFEVYYQPIYDVHKHSFTSAEALIRLNDSFIGAIGPSEFIPISEKTGLIIRIGEYVLEEVCRFLSENDIKEMGLEYIEVNLSTIQCLQRNFIVNLLSLTKKYNVDPSLFCFEITETASNCAPEIFVQNLQCLHDSGFKLAIDDFGTGYGNLQRLISMDFDIVKFDNNTTYQICSDANLRKMFTKLVTMIHSMGAEVVAEGAETKEHYDFLAGIGTDYIQGYYFLRPVNSEDYKEYVANHSKKDK